MNLSEPFIRRPVMTTLVMAALLVFGLVSYFSLPVSELPDVDFPTISVSAHLAGADPETMASTVATPLERSFSSIAGITSMSSESHTGSTRITLQFDLSRDIDAAAQDVQAAISQTTRRLPDAMTSAPTLRKVNPADASIIYLALTSEHLPITRMDQYAETRVAEQISMVPGVAEVNVFGAHKKAVRIYLNPHALAARDLSLGQVAAAIKGGNSNLPSGTLYGDNRTYVVKARGQLTDAAGFGQLVVAWSNDAPVRVDDLGHVENSVQGNKQLTQFFSHNTPLQTAIVLGVKRQPGANTVKVAQAIEALLPALAQQAPGDVKLHVMYSRGDFINASIHEVKIALLVAILLVVIVIFVFLRSLRATVIAALALPTSIIGTFALMQWLGYSLNNLSLMALVLAVGFVVDDAIVVLENIVRHREKGEPSVRAALLGSREISFTVVSMTLSLVAVFLPILLMGGLLGRLFHEFAMTVAIAILLSGVVSLTLTPMLASRFLGRNEVGAAPAGRVFSWFEAGFTYLQRGYGSSLAWSLTHWRAMLALSGLILALTFYFFWTVPKGFIPADDSGQIVASVQAPGGIPFENFLKLQQQVIKIIRANPNVASAMSSVGQGHGADANSSSGFMFISLKNGPRDPVDQVISQLRAQVASIDGLSVYFRNPPAIRIGGMGGSGNYQYVLQGLDMTSLNAAATAFLPKMAAIKGIVGVNSSLDLDKPQINVSIKRQQAAALGVTPAAIQQTLYYAYGGNQVGTIYGDSDEYQVIMELGSAYQRNMAALNALYVPAAGAQLVPLRSVATISRGVGPQSVDHYQQLPSVTLSFGLKPGVALSDVSERIERLAAAQLPASVSGVFAGNAASFQASLVELPLLLLITLLVIYLVLGILYEHFIHPLTILTALPLAMVGALLTLIIFGEQLNIFSFVGLIMLVGLVKKNGIIMVDFAVELERRHGWSAQRSIHEACMVRFRPIMMTSLAAIFGVLPIALATGMGAESRRPLGIAVVGGLVVSQLLTLYITPAFYVAMEKLMQRCGWHQAPKTLGDDAAGAD